MVDKELYLVMLPENYTDIDVAGYPAMEKVATTFAVSTATAIGNVLTRSLHAKAGIVQAIIRDNLGGYDDFAMRIAPDEEYEYPEPEGSPMDPLDIYRLREMEIATMLHEVYGRESAHVWSQRAREIIDIKLRKHLTKGTLEKKVQ